MHDVIVVGAGPAGSVTALLLARAGFDVLVIDRRAFPRPKPCGDCLSAEAGRVLDRLGLLESVMAERPARLEGWRIVAPDGTEFRARFEAVCGGDARTSTALAIERARLDDVLLRAALAEGVRFLAPAHVNDLERGELFVRHGGRELRLQARLVVGADGLRSTVARHIGGAGRPTGQRKLSLTAHVTGIADLGRLGEMHVADGLCAGLAPVTADAAPACNLTLVADAQRFGPAVARGAHAFFRSALGTFPALRDRVQHLAPAPGASQGSGELRLLASGPFDRPGRRTVGDGVALVGDAAGYFDPFTGQGIYQALAGAELLAHFAAESLRTGERVVRGAEMRRYARALRGIVGPAHAVQRLIDHVLRRPRLASAAIARLARRPSVAEALLAVTGDLRPARSLLSPALLVSFAAPRLPDHLG